MIAIVPLNGKYLTDKDVPRWKECLEELYNDCVDPVFDVTFIVTEDCNLRCSYCYQHNKSQKAMSKSTAKRAVDFLFEEDKIGAYYNASQSKGIILEFIGGEPFLEIDLIDYITEYFKYKSHKNNHIWKDNYMLTFSTNGTLMNDSRVQHYIERNKNKVSLSITVDGNQELHDSCRKFADGTGSYVLASNALKINVAANPHASTKLTICPDNVMYLFPAIKNLYEELGCHFVYANCVYEEGWEQKDADTFYTELIKLADYIVDGGLYSDFYCSLFSETIGKPETDLNRNWCGGTGKMLAIGTDGSCYPCQRYTAASLGDTQSPFNIGNINDGLLKKRSMCEQCEKLKCITLLTQSSNECLNCPISTGCSLCSAYNYEKFGDPNVRATYICIMHRARVKANEYFWRKLKDKEMI